MRIVRKILYKIILLGGAIIKKQFVNQTKNCKDVNQKILMEILKKNRTSKFGTLYKFKDIKSIANYKEQVLISDYGFYENYISEMEDGYKNILSTEKIVYFGHTSGTTGKQKLIPCTKSSRRRASKYMALLVNRLCYDNFKENWNYGRGLMISDIVMTTYTKAGIPICSATSGGMKGIKYIINYLYTSPIEVMGIKDKEAALYLHLLFGILETDLMYIGGPFISSVLDLFRTFEAKSDELILDIRNGKISSSINVDENTKMCLNRLLSPNPKRANSLVEEIKKGYKGIIRRIWPNLSYIITVTGANFAIYDDKVSYYTESLPIYSPAYASTEAMFGINPYVDKIRYVIIPDTAFYEFICVEESEKKRINTLGIDELQIGKKYEIVVTNFAGLYRYRVGDVIKVVGFYNNCPEVEFLYRRNQVLNMVSEKTTEEHLINSINTSFKELKLEIVDYTTMPDNSVSPGRYIFYFEFINGTQDLDINFIEDKLDLEICRANLAYSRARNNNKLRRVKVIIVKPNTFNLLKEYLLKKGISKNQIKIPRVISSKNLIELLESNIYIQEIS